MKNISIILMLIICGGSISLAQGSYESREVVFSNDTVRLAGTLTMPNSRKPVKAVVILSGTGQQDRDGSMGKVKMFADVAQYLSERGIAVLRTDDRGTGKSTGNYMAATTADFAADALAGIAFLKNQKGIDPKNIGLLGHSEGGAAMAIAASNSKDVKFLVSMAGLATNGYESLVGQNERIVAAGPQTALDKRRSNEINGMMFRAVYDNVDKDSLQTILERVYAKWKVKDDSVFKASGLEFDHFRFPIYSYSRFASGPWYRYFIKYSAENTIAKVKVPILALNGDQDVFVDASNLDKWKQYAAKGGNTKVTTSLLPGYTHLFITKAQNDDKSVGQVKIAPSILSSIYEWISRQ